MPDPSLPSAEPKTILVVDDSPVNTAILCAYLEELGFRVMVAEDGSSGLEKAAQELPALILLDICMPGMDGFDTCRALKASAATRSIPVIFITGLSDPQDIVKAFEVGAVDYLVKPIQLTEVRARINIHLKMRGLVQELVESNENLLRRTVYLETSHALAQITADFIDLQPMLAHCAALIRERLHYDFVGIWLIDSEKQELRLLGQAGESAPAEDRLDMAAEDHWLVAASHSISTRVFTPERCAQDPAAGFIHRLAAPLGAQGVLVARACREGGFRAEEIELLETLSSQVTVAVRNAQLFASERRRVEEMELMNRQLESFTYSVSHDLRAPMRIISGYSQALREDFGSILPEDGQKYLAQLEANVQRMGQLIEDLLKYSRLGRQAIRKQPIQPEELVRNLLRDLDLESAGRPLQIVIAPMPECQADSNLLKQVWANLITNALKYSRQREAILIQIGSLRQEGTASPVYFIKDNGVGFDMRYADKLFKVFQRLHSAQEYEGSGVGLAIVENIVRRHGGKIWAESQVDQGATFYFTLG